ncbi:MAG: hypothetical protein MUO78_01865, partial [candidate division Zixibacteria bacterium]|nr:hypothetical protein [candidate division Zixibacteria bacterium]
MKKYLILMILLFSLSAFSLTTLAYYAQFYDGTGSRDTVWMNVVTFDTLGFQANADSVWFLRFYRTTLIDSTILTGAGTRSGYYITGKRAFDGTNYGEYTVQLKWKIQGKYFIKSESYTVFPSDTSNIKMMLTNNSFAQTGTDKIWRLRGLAIRGISGSDTAFIAQGYGYGIGILASGGTTGADGIYASGGGTGAGFHSVGGSGDGAEGIFAEGTGTGPGLYALGGSAGSGIQSFGQNAGHGLRLEGGSSSGNGIYTVGGGSGSGIRAVKGGTGYDIYGNVQGSISGSVNSVTSGVTVSTNNDKTNYQLASSEKNFDNFMGTMGASQFEKNVFTDTNFTPGYWHKLAQTSDSGNVGGAATDWTTAERSQIRRVLGITGDTTTQASYGFLDVKISTRSTLTSSDNIGINWADIINATASVNLSGTNISTNQTVARADSVTGVGRISSNLDKTNYSLNSNYLTKADSGSSGASYLRAKHIEDKIGYRLSSQGQADIWINDTTGENSGWAGFFKGRLDANILSRLAPGDSGIMARAPWDNNLIAQAQRRIRYVDSLGEEISGGGTATNPDT